YENAGKLDRALPLHEEALRLRKAHLGDDHPDTLASMYSLAKTYWSAGKLDRSGLLLERLVQLSEAKLGRDHPEVIMYIASLGVNYKDSGRIDQALPLLEEAYEGSKKHPMLRGVDVPLVDAYLKTGRAAETQKAGEVLIEVRKTLPPDSPELAGKLAMYGLAMLKAKAYKEAEPLLRECLTIREKNMPDDWLLFNTKAMLGGALLGQKKYTEAEPLLLAGYAGMVQREETIPPRGRIYVIQSLEHLVTFYEERKADGDAAKAAKYKKLLEARRSK
ncbi:MAG: tetratricopeptide repeat protein, partial [Firmicutes bacterium]|nr:tetratricopeptide repeat protein [Bacillota bacterium]